MKEKYRDYRDGTIVEMGSEWETVAAFLIALFVGGAVLAVGIGLWDLFSSDATQEAFATAIRTVGYGLGILLIMVGVGGLAYGASFFVKSMAPLNLSRGVRENGGMFRTDGVVITLPEGFLDLPKEAQREIISALIAAGRDERKKLTTGETPGTGGGDGWRGTTRTNY